MLYQLLSRDHKQQIKGYKINADISLAVNRLGDFFLYEDMN